MLYFAYIDVYRSRQSSRRCCSAIAIDAPSSLSGGLASEIRWGSAKLQGARDEMEDDAIISGSSSNNELDALESLGSEFWWFLWSDLPEFCTTRVYFSEILYGLALMKDVPIIHCDLKPENILLCTSVKPAEVKIIDFGSACMEDHTVYSYIQTRYYRSPEVVLGYQYTTTIDMWSFGCIVAEVFLGLPLFPGNSEFDIPKRMIKILGKESGR